MGFLSEIGKYLTKNWHSQEHDKIGLGARTVLLESVNFGSLPAGWSNNAWTFDGTRAVSGGNGHNFQLRTGKVYGLQRRIIRWEFALTSAGAKIVFGFLPVENAANKGTYIRINSGTTPSIDIMQAYGGVTAPSLLTNYTGAPYFVDASPNIVTNSNGLGKYTAEFVKDGRSFTFNLYASSGKLIASVSRQPSAYGYTAYPAWGYDQGLITGDPFVTMDTGSGVVYNFNHYAVCNQNPHLYIVSDSTDEGLCVMDHQRPGDIIGSRIGPENVAISACGGSTATSAIARVQAELPYLKPKYMLYKLGTNADASFNASTNTIIAYAQSLGIKVVVCNTAAQYTQSVFLNGLGLPLVDLASVLTVNGAGTTRPDQYYGGYDAAGTFYNDGLHPNPVGNQATVDKIHLDAPYLFDVPLGPNAGTSKLNYTPFGTGYKGNYTFISTDKDVGMDCSVRPCTVYIPLASTCYGKQIRVGKTDSSANAATAAAQGNDKINGATTLAITTQYQFKTLESDGSNWYVVATT